MESGIPEKEEKHGRCMGPAGGLGRALTDGRNLHPGTQLLVISQGTNVNTLSLSVIMPRCWASAGQTLNGRLVEAHRGVALGDLLTIPQQNREDGDG